jgi:hypothetical protein
LFDQFARIQLVEVWFQIARRRLHLPGTGDSARSCSSRSYSSTQLALTPATSAKNLQGRLSECVDNLSHLFGALSRKPSAPIKKMRKSG